MSAVKVDSEISIRSSSSLRSEVASSSLRSEEQEGYYQDREVTATPSVINPQPISPTPSVTPAIPSHRKTSAERQRGKSSQSQRAVTPQEGVSDGINQGDQYFSSNPKMETDARNKELMHKYETNAGKS